MGIGVELKKRIERQEKRLSEIQGQIFDLRMQEEKETAYLQALLDTLKLLPQDELESADAAPEIAMRAGSNVALARDVLRKAGKALHVNEILKAMGKEPNKKDRLSLSGALALYVRKAQVFTRPKPNIFGLREWAGKPVMMAQVTAVAEDHRNGIETKVSTPVEGSIPRRAILRPLN